MNGTRARNSALENVVKAQIPTWEYFGGMSQSEEGTPELYGLPSTGVSIRLLDIHP